MSSASPSRKEALSYYSDHQELINDYIEKNKVSADKIHPSLKSDLHIL